MKKIYLPLILLLTMNGCASKKVAPSTPVKKTPIYASPADLFKSEECAKQVGKTQGDQSMVLKPTVMLLNEAADLFCIQKLQKGKKILQISSALTAMNDEKNPVPDKKFLATAFDLVVYDKNFKRLSLPKPFYRSPSTSELQSFFDFSKEKQFPVYVAILFRSENREQAIFSREMLPSENALIEHSANAAAAGMAMGGFSAGSAASLSQPKESLKYSVYASNPVLLKAEWVREIPQKTVH